METAEEPFVQQKPLESQGCSVFEASSVEALIDPANLFDHPREVVDHPQFTREEKRMILLSWARDELVAEQVTSRISPDLQIRSRIEAVVDALASFDRGAAAEYCAAASSIRAQRLKCGRRLG